MVRISKPYLLFFLHPSVITIMNVGTFWGLTRMLTDIKSFDQVKDMSQKGDNKSVDLIVGDIYGGDYGTLGLKGMITRYQIIGWVERCCIRRVVLLIFWVCCSTTYIAEVIASSFGKVATSREDIQPGPNRYE